MTKRRLVAVAGLRSATIFSCVAVDTTLAQVLYASLSYAVACLWFRVTRSAMGGGRQYSHLCCLENLFAASRILLDCSRSGSAHHASTSRNIYCADKRCRVKRKGKSYPADPGLRTKFSTSVRRVGQPVSNLVPTLFLSLFAVTPRRSFPAFCFLPLFAVTPRRSLSAFCFCFRCFRF